MTNLAVNEARREPFEVSVAQLAWLAVGTVFVAFRFAALLSTPVGGVELDSLAGAWQAHAGNTDERFFPTLFQAVTAWSFVLTTSELPARILALALSCSVPVAIYRLRPFLGESGALVALLVLAIDPVALVMGSTASNGAADIAIALWLVVLLREEHLADWQLAAVGFALATAGAAVIPVVLAFAAVRLLQQAYPSRESALWAAGGAALGAIVASTSFGFGLQDPTLPPFAAFARGFEATWSTESTGSLLMLYEFPVLVLGVLAAGRHAYECWRDESWPETSLGLIAAAVIALAWVVVASGEADPVPLAALAVPLALLIGKAAPGTINAVTRIPWLYASLPLATLVFAGLVAEAYVVDWARVDVVGGDRDKLVVAGLVIGMVACVGLLASSRRTAPAILLPVVAVGAPLMLSGTAVVAFGGPNEPLPSPITTIQGREIRDIALLARQQHGGSIVIHSSFQDASTWPLRDSGELVYATRVPADATVVVWPVTEPAPDGFSVIEGRWSFQETRTAPDGDFLDYLRWLSNRNILKNGYEPLAVYLRTTE